MKLSEIPYKRPDVELLGQKIQDLCTQFENAKMFPSNWKLPTK
ncbi:MAG: hypothetical protein ACPG49_11925 [Chitinophagales bacterium]